MQVPDDPYCFRIILFIQERIFLSQPLITLTMSCTLLDKLISRAQSISVPLPVKISSFCRIFHLELYLHIPGMIVIAIYRLREFLLIFYILGRCSLFRKIVINSFMRFFIVFFVTTFRSFSLNVFQQAFVKFLLTFIFEDFTFE